MYCTKRRPYENHAAKELEDYLSLARTFLSYGVHVHSADALPCTSAHINNLIYDYACMPRAMPYTHTRAPLMEYSRPERRRWGRRDREREREREKEKEKEREREREREKREARLYISNKSTAPYALGFPLVLPFSSPSPVSTPGLLLPSSLYVFIIGTRLVIPLETCVARPNSLICHKSTPDHATVREFVISVRRWRGTDLRCEFLPGQVFDCSSLLFLSLSFFPLFLRFFLSVFFSFFAFFFLFSFSFSLSVSFSLGFRVRSSRVFPAATRHVGGGTRLFRFGWDSRNGIGGASSSSLSSRHFFFFYKLTRPTCTFVSLILIDPRWSSLFCFAYFRFFVDSMCWTLIVNKIVLCWIQE